MNNRNDKPVVVGIDGSSSAVHAVRWAAAEAHRRRTGLHVVFSDVASLVYLPERPMVALPDSYSAAVQRQARGWLEQAQDVANREAPAVDVDTAIRAGAPESVLISESQTAQLVVVGSRGLGGFTGLIVGSVAVALAGHAHCPVAVVRGPEIAVADAPVVVGVDGSRGAETALTCAFEAAAMRGVGLRAVHTWYSVVGDETWDSQQAGGGWASVQADEERLLAELLSGWSEKYPDVDVRRFVTRDKPARALLEHAKHAQLVVVGARGRGGFTGLMLGSTSQQLVYHSPCPVIVAR
ncbi:universal stress protein [Saccharopolyspora pogona]|uniref:universal stress protein n=1 Tax=Saccharopolyspora pogona TaxID=333966 RepID=UPI0016833F77|nr:universal stress protein [Saccharopolyspora pogona]